MHCHLIVCWKDRSNKKKLSPLINHKNTKSGIIKGDFDPVNLLQQVEQEFDKQFSYERQQTESFNYHCTIKNGTISELFKQQKQEIQSLERKQEINQNRNQENLLSIITENYAISTSPSYTNRQTDIKKIAIFQTINIAISKIIIFETLFFH